MADQRVPPPRRRAGPASARGALQWARQRLRCARAVRVGPSALSLRSSVRPSGAACRRNAWSALKAATATRLARRAAAGRGTGVAGGGTAVHERAERAYRAPPRLAPRTRQPRPPVRKAPEARKRRELRFAGPARTGSSAARWRSVSRPGLRLAPAFPDRAENPDPPSPPPACAGGGRPPQSSTASWCGKAGCKAPSSAGACGSRCPSASPLLVVAPASWCAPADDAEAERTASASSKVRA